MPITQKTGSLFHADSQAKMRFKLSPRTIEAKDRIIANAEIRLERDLKKRASCSRRSG